MEGSQVPLSIDIVKTFTGRMHTGYLMTNEAGAVAIVRQGKRGGWFVQTEGFLCRTDMMLDARDLAIQELGA